MTRPAHPAFRAVMLERRKGGSLAVPLSMRRT